MSSLYAQYLEEKTNRKIIETEDGFVTYEINGPQCWIADIYVIRERRKLGIAMQMCIKVAEIAKEAGCKFILGTVQVENKDATEGLMACLQMGMKLLKAENGTVFLTREI